MLYIVTCQLNTNTNILKILKKVSSVTYNFQPNVWLIRSNLPADVLYEKILAELTTADGVLLTQVTQQVYGRKAKSWEAMLTEKDSDITEMILT